MFGASFVQVLNPQAPCSLGEPFENESIDVHFWVLSNDLGGTNIAYVSRKSVHTGNEQLRMGGIRI